MVKKWSKNDPKMVQKWSKNRPKMTKKWQKSRQKKWQKVRIFDYLDYERPLRLEDLSENQLNKFDYERLQEWKNGGRERAKSYSDLLEEVDKLHKKLENAEEGKRQKWNENRRLERELQKVKKEKGSKVDLEKFQKEVEEKNSKIQDLERKI